MKRSKGENVFNVINIIALTMISVVMLYPFLYVVGASLSDPDEVAAGAVWLMPKGITLSSYLEVLNYKGIWMAYGNTLFYVVAGTLISMVVTMCGAYPLSKRRLRGGGIITFLVAFTMWFNAGMIPTYLNLKDLHLLNSRIGILVFGCVSAFYVFIMRTYFASIPDSLEESARIDGANDWRIMVQIYLPLSIPCIATLTLYYIVDRWNGYFWAMILLKDESKIPLQVLLNKLIVQSGLSGETDMTTDSTFNQQTLVYTTIVVSVLPVLCAYPFLQKYFVKGVMVGAIKG